MAIFNSYVKLPEGRKFLVEEESLLLTDKMRGLTPSFPGPFFHLPHCAGAMNGTNGTLGTTKFALSSPYINYTPFNVPQNGHNDDKSLDYIGSLHRLASYFQKVQHVHLSHEALPCRSSGPTQEGAKREPLAKRRIAQEEGVAIVLITK